MAYGFPGAIAALITAIVGALTRRPGGGRRRGAEARFRRRLDEIGKD